MAVSCWLHGGGLARNSKLLGDAEASLVAQGPKGELEFAIPELVEVKQVSHLWHARMGISRGLLWPLALLGLLLLRTGRNCASYRLRR